MTRRQRLEALDRYARRRLEGTLSAVHRAAVLAGAPSRLDDPRRVPLRSRGRAAALMREAGFVGAKMAKRVGGKGVVTFARPGCEGHETCRDICITYQ